jgi:polysaccharide export outer membrane protein
VDAAAGGSGTRTAARPVYVDTLRSGDQVTIAFSGNPQAPSDQEERIKEDGTINLQMLGPVQAAGKTAGQLQKEIQELYVPKFFRRLTITVKTENRVFFVDGEVRQPGRLVYTGEISVLKAIASAGGFTDFAARGRIELVRASGESFVVDARDAKKNPRLDLPVIPGDRIFVPRRSPFGG